MVSKFANPHSLSQDVEITTRSEIARRAGATSVVRDENSHSLKRDLDNLLQNTWAGVLAETSTLATAKRRRRTPESCGNEDGRIAFRLISSMKHPQYISLDPSPQSMPVSRGPDCEDDEMQAETRRLRALAVAVEIERPREVAVLTPQVVPKSVETKAPLASASLARPLPHLLLVEEARTRSVVRRVQHRHPRASESPAASPHEPRVSCTVLPVKSIPDHKGSVGKKQKRQKAVKERPPPAYWRPPPELRGKCMGYALGYPSSWAPDWPYVRDAMK